MVLILAVRHTGEERLDGRRGAAILNMNGCDELSATHDTHRGIPTKRHEQSCEAQEHEELRQVLWRGASSTLLHCVSTKHPGQRCHKKANHKELNLPAPPSCVTHLPGTTGKKKSTCSLYVSTNNVQPLWQKNGREFLAAFLYVGGMNDAESVTQALATWRRFVTKHVCCLSYQSELECVLSDFFFEKRAFLSWFWINYKFKNSWIIQFLHKNICLGFRSSVGWSHRTQCYLETVFAWQSVVDNPETTWKQLCGQRCGADHHFLEPGSIESHKYWVKIVGKNKL